MGQSVRVRFALLPDWPIAGVTAGLGGGPLLVRNGKAVFKSGESIPIADLALRAAAHRGRAARGRQHRAGLGRRRAPRLGPDEPRARADARPARRRQRRCARGRPDGGMAFDGHLAEHAAAGGREQPVADALLVEYAGVYASPPSAPGRVPERRRRRRDRGVHATRSSGPRPSRSSFAARTARSASTRRPRLLPARTRSSGTRAARTGRRSRKARGRSSSARPTTSAGPRASSATSRSTSRSARRRRSRPALTVPRAKPRHGGELRADAPRACRRADRDTVRRRRPQARHRRRRPRDAERRLGRQGRVGRRVAYSGRYVVHAIATSSIGTSDLTAQFAVRRK